MKKLPWEGEPNRLDFQYKGYQCLINRVNHRPPKNPNDWLGHLCGYVALPPSHPYYGKDYDDIPVKVHGGLTYAQDSQGEISWALTPKAWWIGFDCAHYGDLIPGMYLLRQPGGILHNPQFEPM